MFLNKKNKFIKNILVNLLIGKSLVFRVIKAFVISIKTFPAVLSESSTYGTGNINFKGDGVISTRPLVEYDENFEKSWQESIHLFTSKDFHRFHYCRHRAALYSFGASIAQSRHPNAVMVECGVWYGMLAYLTLDRFKARGINQEFHLIDLFGIDAEKYQEISKKKQEYNDNTLYESVKKRFSKFNAFIHQGYIPNIFEKEEIQSIENISFLSCDLNNLNAEKASFEFFSSKLNVGSVLYIDDYGCQGYEKTRSYYDEVLKEKFIFLKTLHSPALAIKVKN